jgi:phosphoenolpyruvate---glycerone phosphotransferase subunit DhaL
VSVVRAAILAAADAVESAREALCELDAKSGDGDHGVTMAIGSRNVRRRLSEVEGDDPAALVRAAAMGMAGIGGAIGPIYGSGLLAIARTLDANPGSELPGRSASDHVGTLASCAEAALTAVRNIGRAGVGDKTIVDALAPLADALRAAADAGLPTEPALEAAELAAKRGADSTVDMVATIGRSSRFGEASRGTADPGASSFALIVEALVVRVGRDGAPDAIRDP